jgi:hypothetical protein
MSRSETKVAAVPSVECQRLPRNVGAWPSYHPRACPSHTASRKSCSVPSPRRNVSRVSASWDLMYPRSSSRETCWVAVRRYIVPGE